MSVTKVKALNSYNSTVRTLRRGILFLSFEKQCPLRDMLAGVRKKKRETTGRALPYGIQKFNCFLSSTRAGPLIGHDFS